MDVSIKCSLVAYMLLSFALCLGYQSKIAALCWTLPRHLIFRSGRIEAKICWWILVGWKEISICQGLPRIRMQKPWIHETFPEHGMFTTTKSTELSKLQVKRCLPACSFEHMCDSPNEMCCLPPKREHIHAWIYHPFLRTSGQLTINGKNSTLQNPNNDGRSGLNNFKWFFIDSKMLAKITFG